MTSLSAPDAGFIVQAPLFPLYSHLAHAVKALDGEPVQKTRGLLAAIKNQMGTPQNPVDWSRPDEWIYERLTGDLQNFAAKIWENSDKNFNPRYLYGCYLFINRLLLLEKRAGVYRLEERGQSFLRGDEAILSELDAIEGLPKLLAILAERSPCKSGDVLPAWSDYLKIVSVFSTPKTFADTLRRRLTNLIERKLARRDGFTYSITEKGLAYLKGFSNITPEITADAASQRAIVFDAAHAHNKEQLKAFKNRLMALEPTQFEHFVRALLEAMEYEDVQVTRASGDMGVDVIGKFQFGITEITEVVQVKRTEATIARPKIDELRGALHYHRAIRGAIISLGTFTEGAKEGAIFPGAAPITLIDGKRLLELCLKHRVGIKQEPVYVYAIDEAFFLERFGEEADELHAVEAEDEGYEHL